MVKQMTSILGKSLYVPNEVSLFGQLPSPISLQGMVVVKGKRPDGTEADQYDSDYDSETEAAETFLLCERRKEVEKSRQEVVKHGVLPELASLTLFHGFKLKSFDDSQRTKTYSMHSFSESKVRSICRHRHAAKWITFNQTHMSRTYPAYSRYDSSNYNPLLAWSTGCQMVALNFQTEDAFLRLNDGRFRENGGCGYVLKPSSLMSKEPLGTEPESVRLSVRVISGSCLPKPKGNRTGDCINPYVNLALYDVANEEKEVFVHAMTAAVSQSNGYFPIWGQEEFKFSVENWSVAMLQLTLMDKNKDAFIASTSIPVSCLRRGIRCTKLYDETNTRSGAYQFGSLLLDIDIGQRVAEI